MDSLMAEMAGKPMLVRSRRKLEPIQAMRKTLRAHTSASGATTDFHPHFYDRDCGGCSRAARTMPRDESREVHRRARRDVRRMVAEGTGEYQYKIDQVIEDMMKRATS